MPVPEDGNIKPNGHGGSVAHFYEPVYGELRQVCELISSQLQSPEEAVNNCLNQIKHRQGKMLRPALTLLCGKLISPLNSRHIEYAAMSELVHMASLLHDDVIDGSDLRRGEPSINTLWGNTAAVLLGDFLLAKAFALGADNGNQRAVNKLIQTAQILCEGELTQDLCKDSFSLTEADYLRIIQKKTAALFSCCCGLGAIASDASEQETYLLEQFGLKVGFAFQITDDLKDLLANCYEEGKPLHADILNGTLTLPVIHWLSQSPDNKRHFGKYLKTGCDEKFIRSLMSGGSIDYAMEKAAFSIEDAKNYLSSFDNSTVKKALLSVADNIIISLP